MNSSPARFAFEPLWEKAAPQLRNADGRPNRYSANGEPTLAELIRRTGIRREQWARYRRDGLTLAAADRAALALGFMPWDIWDEWWDVGDETDVGDDDGEAA